MGLAMIDWLTCRIPVNLPAPIAGGWTVKLNHFALRAKLYTRALRVAFDALAELQPTRLAA